MDKVFRVPVKSLVATENTEEEEEVGDKNGCNGYSSPESESESSSSSSSSSEVIQPHIPYVLKNCLEGSLFHLFLPKRLPDSLQPDLLDIEFWILQQVTDTFQDVLRFPKLFPITKMFSSWKASQPKGSFDRERFARHFNYELDEMEENDTLAIYIRKQNATILFTKENAGNDKSRIKVETFRASLPSELVMSSVGSIQLTFPETSHYIYNEKLLSSEVFAKQLHELSVEEFESSRNTSVKAGKEFIEYRQVSDPFLVSDWVVAVLCPTSEYQSAPKTLKVTKKLRDEVNCKRSANAISFRRSGLWTSIKVALHLKILQIVQNENDSKIIYKCLILRVLAEITQKYGDLRDFHLDLLSQLISKLGRRVRKLQRMTCEKQSIFQEEILYLYSTTMKSVHLIVTVLNEKLKTIWLNECFHSSDSGMIPSISKSKEEFKSDLLHDIPWLVGFIEKRLSPLKSSIQQAIKGEKKKGKNRSPPQSLPKLHLNSKQGFQEKFTRYHSFEAVMSPKTDIKNLTQLKIWKFDAEKVIKKMHNVSQFEDNSKGLLDLLLIYVTRSLQPYLIKDNPVGFSQTVLVVLKLVQFLDKLAIAKYPMLLQYKTGINSKVFDKLVLPHKDDMRLLDDLLHYFKGRDQQAQFQRGGILDSILDDISPTSFTSRFASNSEEMVSLRNKILEDMEIYINDKRKEVEKVQEECFLLRNELEERGKGCKGCELELESSDFLDTEKSNRKCGECLELEEKLERKRYSVPVYEKPLPAEEHLQCVIAFELRIPEELKNLREGIALLKFDLLREFEDKISGGLVQVTWTNYKSVSSYRTSEKMNAKRKEENHFALSSRLLATSGTHYTRIRNPDLLNTSKEKVSDDFIVPNGLDCVYFYKRRYHLSKNNTSLGQLCTYQLSSITEERDDPYYSLQWALEGTSHSQNRIIAEFSSTYHPELVAFGSVRAGHRIQLMNLYRYISNKHLQLEKEQVLALILQTLWEIGPSEDGDDESRRETHLDFLDDQFTEEFLKMLEGLLDVNDTNYSNPLILLNVVVMTVRILELNVMWRQRCYNLLRKCRSCADSWLELIQTEISKRDKSFEEDGDEDEGERLIKMQLEISLCSALSFNVGEELFGFVLQDAQDLLHWFQTLSRINELTTEGRDQAGVKKLLSPFEFSLLELSRQVPLKLDLEGKLSSSIKFKDLFIKCLHIFSCEKWDWGAGAARWELCEETQSSNIVTGQYQEDIVTFDLLNGTFLVNGFFRSGIPLNISEHPLFEMYFRGQANKLKVVQSQGQHESKDRTSFLFRTTDKFHGKHYEFELFPRNNIAIREITEERKLELLDPDKFQGIFGDELVYMYTHWVDFIKKVVYFKKIPMQEADYQLPAEYTLTIDNNSSKWLLKDELTKSFIFSRKSIGFKTISKALGKLDLIKYLNVFYSEGDEASFNVVAKLPRLHLTFTLENGYLLSREFKNYKVSNNQYERGTLIGLEQGLLLDNVPVNKDDGIAPPPLKRILLVPHGKVDIEGRTCQSHQITKVDLRQLRQPPFFSYEFDPILKRLKGDKSKSAWLYLALLHGATSSCSPMLVDPFTQQTGTEMAVQILQSGFVWSCSPYDQECLSTLKMIRRLAPTRQYYGHGLRTSLRSPRKGGGPSPPPPSEEEQMETTEWPQGLSSTAAFDGFGIIVEKLLDDSQRLSVLYPKRVNQDDKRFERPSSVKLQTRAYYRHLGSYNKAVVVKPQFFMASPKALNENVVFPEILIHKSRSIEDKEEENISFKYKLNLKMLLRISQARFVSTLEDPVIGSHRRSDLSFYLLSPEVKVEVLNPSLPIPDALNGVPLKHLLDGECDLRENWLKFYQMAISWSGSAEGKEAFSLVLSALAYQGANIGQLLNLHNISVLSEKVSFPSLNGDIETCSFIDFSSENDFSEEKLKQFLTDRAHTRSPDGGVERVFLHGQVRVMRRGQDERKEVEKLETYEGKLELESKIDEMVKELKSLWPCEKVPRNKLDKLQMDYKKFWSSNDFNLLNIMIAKWHRNYQLKTFIQTVEGYLDKFYEHFPNIPKHSKQFETMNEVKAEFVLKPPSNAEDNPYELITNLVIDGDLDEPGVIFYSGSAFQETNVEALIPTQREQCQDKIQVYMERVMKSIGGGSSKQVIAMSGLAPRMCPVQLLKYLLYGLRSPPGSVHPTFLKMTGALAVLWTELKRFNRILALINAKNVKATELKQELENSGHENWSPVDHPEWLVLELELDIMIRPIQVDVAKQMIQMPGDRNGVMQLNMGEGKTSVIVPMLCLSLSQQPETICRVTVLHSIFKMNLNLLSFAIGGGILSRRVYTFPCRRDMEIELDTLEKILQCYQECLKLKGAVLTLPEYRLSFRLLAFDKALKSYPEIGVKFLEIENGLRRYSRDILDESDELLNVKYQLVYTIGAQIPVDGGNMRWVTCQKVLQIVQDIAWVFLGKMGSGAVEFNKEQQQRHPEQFAYFRLLNLEEDAMDEFRCLVADEFLKEFKLTERQKVLAKKLLTQEKISEENFKFVMSMFKNDQTQLDEIRLVSGYLKREILALALSKRWRVEYGVDQGREGVQYRRMAVPFRAKDCPSDKTEFGHPDLAIILTHLSYYYSGLSSKYLEEVFDLLKAKPEADTIYSSWVGRLENFPKYLTTFAGVNLNDVYQRSNLFSALRKHKLVIDFFLSHKVFPIECKQFPGKISMSAWDLCYEKQKLAITGFSGTNDSSILLPLPISQQDLKELQTTNQKMEKILLQPENANHKGFQMGVTCKEILEEMKKDSRRVLIDAGALMLECDNEQVAQLWLEIDNEIEAVVYFSKENEIVVKCRVEHGEGSIEDKLEEADIPKGKHFSHSPKRLSPKKNQVQSQDTPIELSPYRDRLEKCGVFLDDQHTRGTDLKFPVGAKACVTIGSRMRRDKLMQACMRMRQLGSGHSVTFYLSHEASTKISHDKGEILTRNVLNWVTTNTEKFNQEGLVYWALAGKNYAKKLAAQEFHDIVDSHALEKIYCLARQVVDDEILLLKDMYGTYLEAELLTKLIPEWFELTQRKLQTIEGCYSLSQKITRRYDKIRDAIRKRIQDIIPDKLYLGGMMSLEEEQEKEIEREMEMETEEERQIVRPKKMDYFEKSILHENVKKAVIQGQKLSLKPGISRLADIFEKTSFSKLVQPESWASSEVYASTDFISVVKPYEKDEMEHFRTDAHLRPLEFIVSIRSKPSGNSNLSFKKGGAQPQEPLQVLVLSPFEVNELLPYFRQGKVNSQLHMFSARTYLNQNLLVNTPALQVPRPLLQSPILSLLPDDSKCLAALLLASGNLYFATLGEQKSFARFLGLVPRPWSPEQMNAFEKEMIRKTGFLLPKYRRQQMDSCQIEEDAFQKDPIPLVRKILSCRHVVVSDVAHVSRLLNNNWYIY